MCVRVRVRTSFALVAPCHTLLWVCFPSPGAPQCALKFKANKMGVVPDGNALVFNNVPPGSSGLASVALSCVASQFSAEPFSDKVWLHVPADDCACRL